jgi:hypothetical protein
MHAVLVVACNCIGCHIACSHHDILVFQVLQITGVQFDEQLAVTLIGDDAIQSAIVVEVSRNNVGVGADVDHVVEADISIGEALRIEQKHLQLPRCNDEQIGT